MGNLRHISEGRRSSAPPQSREAGRRPREKPAPDSIGGGDPVKTRREAPSITSLDPCTILRLQSWDVRKGPPAQAESVLGLLWPKLTGAVARGRVDMLCIGPTDWLVLARDPHAAALLQALSEAFSGSSYRATDVSSALSRIQIEGPHTRTLLAKGCSLDLHPEAFTPDRVTRTRFAGMPVVVRCAQPSTFECMVSLSYRDYLLAWLDDAAMEF